MKIRIQAASAAAAVLLALVLTPIATGAQDKRPPFRVHRAGKTVPTVDVAVAKDATSAEVELTLRATGRAHTIDGIAADVPALGDNVKVTVAGGSGERLVKKDRALKLVLSVSNVASPGTFTGFLNATVDGVPTLIAPIVVAKNEAPKVQLAASYSFTSGEKVARYAISVINPTKNDLVELTPQLLTLTGPSGTLVEPELDPPTGALSITAGEAASVTIDVELPVVGTYTGLIEIRSVDGLLGSAPVTIAREAGALPVTITPPGQFSDSSTAFGKADLPIVLNLVDTNGADRDLQVKVHVTRRDDPKDTIARARLEQDGDCSGTTPTLPVGDLEASTYVAQLCGLPGAGRYQATFTLSDGSRAPAVTTADVDVRRNWFVAVLCIGLGVAVSAVIGMAIRGRSKRRVKLALRSASAHLLKAEMTGGGAAVIAAVRLHIAQVYEEFDNDLAIAKAVDDQARFALTFAALDRSIQTHGLAEPSSFATIRTALLTDPSSTLPAALASTESELITAIAIVDAGLRAQPTIAAVREGREQLLREGGTVDLSRVDAAETELRTAISNGRTDEVPRNARLLALEFARVLSTRLASAMEKPPKHFASGLQADPGWTAAKSAAEQTMGRLTDEDLVVDQPMRAYQDAANALIRAETTSVLAQIDRQIRETQGRVPDADFSQEDKDAWLAALGRARQAAVDAETQVREGRAQAAQRLLIVANDAMPTEQRPEAGTDPTPPGLIDVQADAIGAIRSTPPPPARVDVHLGVGPLDWLVGLTSLVVAVLLGLQTLYYANAAWGTAPDIIAALLFGLGLSGSAFAGLVPLRRSVEAGANA